MTYYVITRNGVPVSISFESPFPMTDPELSAHTFDGPYPDLNVSVWNPEKEQYEASSNLITKLAFLNRFTSQERIAIRSSADPVVHDIMQLFDAAEHISASNPNTIEAFAYFQEVNLLTAERVQEILG